MDDDSVALAQFPTVVATLKGQAYIDEEYECGSWDHAYYTAFLLLFDRHPRAWWTHYELLYVVEGWPNAKSPNAARLKVLGQRLADIFTELGISSRR